MKTQKMKITIKSAKFIVTNATKRIDVKTGELLGYDMNAFFRFRNVFICKDAVSGYMVVDSCGKLTDSVIYKYYECSDTARRILALDI